MAFIKVELHKELKGLKSQLEQIHKDISNVIPAKYEILKPLLDVRDSLTLKIYNCEKKIELFSKTKKIYGDYIEKIAPDGDY